MRMEGHARTWFTPKQKAELWERRKSGQCVADIARALERRNKSGVYRVLAGNGGIAPAPRRRALVALRLEEREEILRGIAAGRSIRRIAQALQLPERNLIIARDVQRIAAKLVRDRVHLAEQIRRRLRRFSASSQRGNLKKSITNIASECRSANIVRDHAMILPDDATPKLDGIFGKYRSPSCSSAPAGDLSRLRRASPYVKCRR